MVQQGQGAGSIEQEALRWNGSAAVWHTAAILRGLAELKPATLALMHGSSFRGEGAGPLNALADWCEARQRAPAA